MGEEEKKLRMPPLDAVWATGGGIGAGTGAGAGGGGDVIALNCAMTCGSRRTFRVSVNSSLLCSILGPRSIFVSARRGEILTVQILAL